MRNIFLRRIKAFVPAAAVLALVCGLAACSDPSADMVSSLKDAPPVQKARHSPSPRAVPNKQATVSAPVRPVALAPPRVPATATAPLATIADCRETAECAARLSAMVADPDQSWMAKEPTAIEFSTGTRLFAFRALKTKLDCRKLASAAKELAWAIATFSKPVPGLKDRVAALVRDETRAVQTELAAETKSRCG